MLARVIQPIARNTAIRRRPCSNLNYPHRQTRGQLATHVANLDGEFHQSIRSTHQPTEIIGQVMNAEANFVRVRVLTDDLTKTSFPLHAQLDRQEHKDLLCVVRSVLKKMRNRVLVGDYVKIASIDWTDERGMVSEVLPRETMLTDPPVANINHVLVLLSILEPPFDVLQASRFLVEAESVGVPVTLAINKTDLSSEIDVLRLCERVTEWGYNAVTVSCHSGSRIDGFQDALKDKVSAVIGPSGVGKSSLINALRKDTDMIAQSVGDVSSIGRGRHTTRAVSFLQLPDGGYLVDTPGFNIPDLASVSSESLQRYFPEIARKQQSNGENRCKFADCQHISEPNCVVNCVEWDRHATYVRLHKEIKEREIYEKQVLQLSKKRREGFVKVKSAKGGDIQKEALLEAKRHRRVSRNEKSRILQDLVREETDNADDLSALF